MQMDGPGLHYVRASYRKQAAQVAAGKSRMLRDRPPAEAQAGLILLNYPPLTLARQQGPLLSAAQILCSHAMYDALML